VEIEGLKEKRNHLEEAISYIKMLNQSIQGEASTKNSNKKDQSPDDSVNQFWSQIHMHCKYCLLLGQFLQQYSHYVFQILKNKNSELDFGTMCPFFTNSTVLYQAYVMGPIPLLKFV